MDLLYEERGTDLVHLLQYDIFDPASVQERATVQAGKDDRNYVEVSAEDMEGVTAQVVTPIICEGDAIGAVVIMSREPRAKFSEGELRLAATAAGFLGRQMES